jgi:hypothetical protein
MKQIVSRRYLLQAGATLGVLAAVETLGCGKKKPALSCADTSALSPADAQVRTTLAYVDLSVEPGKMCSVCQQFIPGAPTACGTCKVVKGPINPRGYCKSFLAKPAAA